jgi:hypothetical protein
MKTPIWSSIRRTGNCILYEKILPTECIHTVGIYNDWTNGTVKSSHEESVLTNNRLNYRYVDARKTSFLELCGFLESLEMYAVNTTFDDAMLVCHQYTTVAPSFPYPHCCTYLPCFFRKERCYSNNASFEGAYDNRRKIRSGHLGQATWNERKRKPEFTTISKMEDSSSSIQTFCLVLGKNN